MPAMECRNITIESHIEPMVIRGNRELLVTAFVNLMDNARKASEEGSVIEFTGQMVGKTQTEETEAWYELCVTDHGIGMTGEEASRICDEFYMVDKSRARREGGAGIGMSLVALILEHHGAVLSIESRPGEGTRMRVRFPQGNTDAQAGRITECEEE